MKNFVYSGLAVLALIGSMIPAFGTGNGGQIASKGWTLDIRDGMVVSGSNLLTGEQSIANPESSVNLAGLYRIGNKPLDMSAAKVKNSARPGVIEQLAEWTDDTDAPLASMTVRFEKDASGDLVVMQSGKLLSKGLYGISWGIADIPDTCSILVPGESGQEIKSDSPFGTHTFEYPFTWEAPFVIIRTDKVGFIIRAEDPNFQFKALFVEHISKSFRLRFETRNQAPFEDKDSIKSVKWKVSAFKGRWQNGAEIYHRWAKQQYKLVPIEQKKPSWAKDIRFVATMSMDILTLRELAKKVNPGQTLLYIPDWRRDGYDRNYPNYTARPEFAPFVEAAHKLGYKVMAHVNYFGVDVKNPAYEKLQKYQLRDPFTKEPQYWWPPVDLTIKVAYIDPASSEWRKLFVSKMQEIVRNYNVDAFHIDQTLVMINDANGLIDGMNCIQGNIQLHRDLQKALPEIALSGEGLDEVTCMYETFAQRHVTGIDLWNGTWNDQQLSQAHPVSSYLLTPYTTMYGYLGMTTSVNNPGNFTAWRKAYERYGVIPTYTWPSVDQLKNPTPLSASVLEDARLFQKYLITPDFKAEWNPNDLFVYKLSDGRKAFYRRDNGVIFGIADAKGKVDVISKRISGVNEVTTNGSILGWLAYNDKAIIGLDPKQSYQWSPDKRDLNALHISKMPQGRYNLVQSGIHNEFARFKLDSIRNSIDLWNYGGQTACGVKFSNGKEERFSGINFTAESGGASQTDGDGLAVHPPWKAAGKNADGITEAQSVGNTFVEYTIDLPKSDRITFSGGLHLRTGAVGKSDGVVWHVIAKSGDQTVSGEIQNDKEEQKSMSLDLSPFAGKRTMLRFEIDPGPAGSATFDWGRIAHPTISIESSEDGYIDVVSSKPIVDAVAANGKVAVSKVSGKTYRLSMPLPNTVTIPYTKPVTAIPPFDLMSASYTKYALPYTGVESGLYEFANAAPEAASCKGETRPSLQMHPPSFGKTLVDYWITLPAEPLRLSTAVGLRDGSKSKGAEFEVQVNGKPVMSRTVMPYTGWTHVDVDLTAWAGQPVMLTLIVDSLGDASFDWTAWAEPKLVR